MQSKHCSFACVPLEGRVNEASVARSAFFIIKKKESVPGVFVHSNVSPSLSAELYSEKGKETL